MDNLEQLKGQFSTINSHNKTCDCEMCQYINALEAELKAREWQPIETAPKDGTRILATSLGCAVHIHYWHTDGHWRIDYAGGPSWEPTIWMQVPSRNIPTAPTPKDKVTP